MTKQKTAEKKFSEIQEDRPSAIRTTAWFGPIGWVLRPVGNLLFLTGLFFLVMAIIENKIFDLVGYDNKSNSIFMSQGIASIIVLLLGPSLGFVGRLCRRIVNRNMYILDLEEFIEEELIEDKQV